MLRRLFPKQAGNLRFIEQVSHIDAGKLLEQVQSSKPLS